MSGYKVKRRKGGNPIFPSSLLSRFSSHRASVAVAGTTTARLEKKSGNTGTKALINSNCSRSLARSKRYYGIPGLSPFYGYRTFLVDVPFFLRGTHRALHRGRKSCHGGKTERLGSFRFFRPDRPDRLSSLEMKCFWQPCSPAVSSHRNVPFGSP